MKKSGILRWHIVLAGVVILIILIGIAIPARRVTAPSGEVSGIGEQATEEQADDADGATDEYIDDTVRLFAGSEGSYPNFPSDIILNVSIGSLLEQDNAAELLALWYAAGEALVVWLDDDYCTQVFGETDLEELSNEDDVEYLQAVNRLNTAFHQILEYITGGEHSELVEKALAYYYHEDGTLGTGSNPTQVYLDGQAYLEEVSGQ